MQAFVPSGVQPATDCRRAAVIDGVRAITPLVAGLAPLALTVGTTAAKAGLPPLVGWASSAVLYGASGQLTWIHVVAGGAPAALAVGATLMVNLQLVLYGTAMRPFWTDEPRWWRVAAAQLLVSPVFAVATNHHRSEPDPCARRAFYVGAGATLWLAWLGLTGTGYALGGVLPPLPVLSLLTALVMLTLALRTVVDAATLAALIVAATVAVVGGGVPYDLGFVGAGLAGIVTGVTVDAVTAPKGEMQEDRR
jgi:predicted branched-subunit amino acid permease